MVQELLQPERPNIFDGTIRDRPELWTAGLWRDTYRLPRGGSRLSNRMEGHHKGRFMHQVDPKDGYSVSGCRVDRHQQLLEFMVPIVHPDKPTRVTITIGNTIFGALDGGREVDWGLIFRDMVQRLAKGVGKPKPTPICPFLFHLYEGQGLLKADKEVDYRTAKEMAGYRITPDPDSRPGTDEDEPTPTPAPSPRLGPSRTPNRRRKSTYRAPSGSPPVRSKEPSSPVRPEPQPRKQQPAPQPEGGPEWVDKPFASIAKGFRQARNQYESMEKALEQIGSELGVGPEEIIPTIRSLAKVQETEGLRVRIASLITENDRLQTQVADQNRRAEAAEAQTLVAASQASTAETRAAAAEARAAAAEEAQALAESESTKWHGVARKFFDSFGFPGDVVTKARIFDQCMKKPKAVSAAKILRMLVDFSARIENLLKEIWSAFQLDDRGHEAGPSEQCAEPVPRPSRPEPSSPPTATVGAPPTGAPSASTPQPEATPSRPKAAATPSIPDPTRQEPIPDSLNTDDISSLHQWGMEDLPESVTPATGSRGPIDPVIRITPGSVPRSQPRRPGSVQTNLFGGTPDDPTAGFRRHMRHLADELQAETGEEQKISGDEDDSVTENPIEETAAEPEAGNEEEEEDEAANEDEEEEEDPGLGNSGDDDDDDDDDSPPTSSHRPVIQSTPKKQPVSRPKRKAYRNKSGPGSSSRKWTRNR